MNFKRYATRFLGALHLLTAAGFASGNSFAAEALPIGSDNEIYAKIGSCNFRFASMQGVRYANPEEGKNPQIGAILFDYGGKTALSRVGLPISLTCEDAKEPDAIANLLAAVYRDGQWEAKDGDGNWVVQFDRTARVQTFEIHGRNAWGKALLYNDAVGDEDQRSRHINFCMIHNSVALCGRGSVQWLRNPKVDSTSEMKQLIESIQFIDR
ncbi:hypothetical protein [Robbsia sp. KACC 23696]|uniref:hypothetical protein n=1 Tax=Robbsia sp. KACC 23696 TaxID=3149231 RepID=UPI00325B6460